MFITQISNLLAHHLLSLLRQHALVLNCWRATAAIDSIPAAAPSSKGVTDMSGRDDKVKGTFEEAKGKAKQAWGDLTDNEEVRLEGQLDEAKGKGRQSIGHLKDAADDVKKALDRDKS